MGRYLTLYNKTQINHSIFLHIMIRTPVNIFIFYFLFSIYWNCFFCIPSVLSCGQSMTQSPLTELLQKYSTERLRHLHKHNGHSFVLLSSISVSSLTTSTATGGGGCCCCWCSCWFCWGLSCCCGGGGFWVHSLSYPNKAVKWFYLCLNANTWMMKASFSLHHIHLSLHAKLA